MNNEQYEKATVIMKLCRIFAKQMHRCMSNAGLLKEGYTLQIHTGLHDKYTDGSVMTARIAMEKSCLVTDEDEWERSLFMQLKFSGKEWMIDADPIAEKRTVPKSIGVSERIRTVSEGMGENPSKPYPVDGLWIGSADNDSVLDGWQ